MSGGLMQLVAYGAQDVYLTGNPSITFFKVVYRRHTNFAIESIVQTLSGTAAFDNTVTATISRNGDLIHRMYVQLTLPAVTITEGCSFRWIDDIGNFIISEAVYEVGGQRIDKHTGDWLFVYNQLTQTAEKKDGYKDMIGQTEALTTFDGTARVATVLCIPLQFYFCRNIGLALPLIALQYHEVKIIITFRAALQCYVTDDTDLTTPSISNVQLWVDYIYLDTLERRRMAQSTHEYLIEQLQYTSESVTQTEVNIKLNFNHPVKELIWTVTPYANTVAPSSGNDYIGYQWSNYGLDAVTNEDDWVSSRYLSDNPCDYVELYLNNQPRFAKRTGRYFNETQPYQHHTNVPTSPGINVYSFAHKPEEHQPTGTCNLSRIDSAVLRLYLNSAAVTTSATVRIYAVNYNVFRASGGMGGIAYSA